MPTPASFCTIATKSCAYELIGLLLSLSKFHPKATVFIMCDSATQEEILAITPQPRLSIHWVIDLNTYTALDRKQMEAQGIFKEFLKSKAKIMKHALNTRKDVLFLDSDIILTAPIVDINKNRALGVSKQYLVKASLEETGYYNAGMLWTNSKDVCEDWMKFTEKSRYFEQTAIEDLVNKYSNFKFGEEYNVQCWRYYLGSDPAPYNSTGFGIGRHGSLPSSYLGSPRVWIASSVINGTTNVNDGNWHNVIVTRESGGVRIYVDGAEEVLHDDSNNIISSPYTMNGTITVTKTVIGALTSSMEF